MLHSARGGLAIFSRFHECREPTASIQKRVSWDLQAETRHHPGKKRNRSGDSNCRKGTWLWS